jgi:hypothetical protein
MAGTTHHFMVASDLKNYFYPEPIFWHERESLAPSAGTILHLVAMVMNKSKLFLWHVAWVFRHIPL